MPLGSDTKNIRLIYGKQLKKIVWLISHVAVNVYMYLNKEGQF